MVRHTPSLHRHHAVHHAKGLAMRRCIAVIPLSVVLLIGSLVLSLRPAMAVQEGIKSGVLRVNWGGGFYDTLDPQLSHEGQWAISGGLDYEGLTRIDEELNSVPGAAESWAFSPDGMTVTFHLRDGLVFSDGVPVTAEHFVYAAQRMCSPELLSASAIQLFEVVGCEALFHSGDDPTATPVDDAIAAAEAALGVRALDEHTVEYRFETPAPYLPVLAASWGFIPLRKELIEAGGPQWWASPATRVGNGPFRLVEQAANGREARLVYARNDRYRGGPTKLDGLEFYFANFADPATLEAYRNGAYDVTWPVEEILTAVEIDPILSRELVTMPIAGTIYYAFNLTREPFQDPQVRQAFAYAFDRQAYCRQLVAGACRPALGWIAPGAPGFIETDAYVFNPVKAREVLASSSYAGPEHLPAIDWYVIADEPSMAQDAEWLAAQFRQALGVELNIVTVTEDEYDALYNDPATSPQIHESTWFAEPDPRDWFIVWRCGSDFNDGYCNPDLDALLDRADAELDPEARMALYEEAGRLLLADAPAVFVHSASNTMLVKPSVVGYSHTTPNGNWPGWTNLMNVDVVPSA